MGFAGFFDGIVLHQILQWHHMLTSVRPTNSLEDLEANTFWDGVFLMAASVFTATGLILLWRSTHQQSRLSSTKVLVASLLLGTGGFNLVEGLIDHHWLGIHHVKSGSNELAWDIGFLLLNLVLGLVGVWLLREQRSPQPSGTDTPAST